MPSAKRQGRPDHHSRMTRASWRGVWSAAESRPRRILRPVHERSRNTMPMPRPVFGRGRFFRSESFFAREAATLSAHPMIFSAHSFGGRSDIATPQVLIEPVRCAGVRHVQSLQPLTRSTWQRRARNRAPTERKGPPSRRLRPKRAQH